MAKGQKGGIIFGKERTNRDPRADERHARRLKQTEKKLKKAEQKEEQKKFPQEIQRRLDDLSEETDLNEYKKILKDIKEWALKEEMPMSWESWPPPLKKKMMEFSDQSKRAKDQELAEREFLEEGQTLANRILGKTAGGGKARKRRSKKRRKSKRKSKKRRSSKRRRTSKKRRRR